MKGRLTAALLSLALLLALPMAVQADAGLLTNGDFESAGGWTDQDGNTVAAQQETEDIHTSVTDYRIIDFESFAEAETLTALSGGWNLQNQGDYFGIETVDGSKVLRMTKDADTYGRYLSYYGASITTGVTYRITYRAKASQAIFLQTYFAGSVTGSDHIAQLNTQWQTVTYEFVSPKTQDPGQLFFNLYQDGGSGTVYIDDLSIQIIETTGNTVIEPVQKYYNDFSDGSILHWNVNNTTYAVTEKNGEQVLSFTPGGNTYITYYGVPFEAGKTYTVSCKVLTDTVISFRLYNEATGTAVYQIGNTVPGQWTDYSITVTAGSAVSQPSTYFGNMTGSGTVYIDDVQVVCNEEVPATTYTEGIGNCLNTEDSNVLAMKAYTKVYQSVSLTQGTDYAYSFRVKGVDMGSDLAFGVQYGEAAVTHSVTDSWSTLSGVFTASQDTMEFGFFRSGTGTVLLDDVVLAPLNCDHLNTQILPAEVASCTEAGQTQGEKCTDCGLTLSQPQEIPALGHSFDQGVCTRCGCDEKAVVLRFAVLSDIHISTQNQVTATNRKNRFAGMFTTAYNYAANQEYTGLDAVVVAGDLVDYGTQAEYELFDQIVNANIKAGTKLITLAGNHEFWGDQDATGYKNYISAETDKAMDVVTTVGGYTFIALSQHDNDVYTQDQKLWLAEALQQAADDQKPIFTFQHFGITNTVYGMLDDTVTDRPDMAVTANLFHEEYAKYQQVINFSGHTHTPINTPTIISQVDGYTQVATGTLYDMYMQNDASYGTQPPNSNDIAQYYIVEVHADNSVTLLPYNILTGDFFNTPATEDGDTQLVYEVDVNDPENWLYTQEKQETTAPFFTENAQISFSDVTYKGAKVTFSQACDEHSGVYLYEIVCTPEAGEQKTFTIFSEYYFEPTPENLSYGITGLLENTVYDVAVTPVDFYSNRGTALHGTLQTASSADEAMQLQISYTDKNSSADKDIDLLVSNPMLLTGDYYSIEVIADGVSGKVAASNYADGTMTVWSSFITAIDKLTVQESLLIPAGSCMEQVTSAGWKAIEGGDRETVRNALYLEVDAAGTDYEDKTAYYNALVQAEAALSDITEASCSDEAQLQQILEQAADIAANTKYLTDRVTALEAKATALLTAIEHTDGHIEGWNLQLADSIGVNFHICSQDTAELSVFVTVADATYTAALQPCTDESCYKVFVELSAAQMTEQIFVQTVMDGETVDEGTYSVKAYADAIINGEYNEQTKNLVKYMLSYGGASQIYFDYNPQALASDGVTVTPVAPEGQQQLAVTGGIDGVSFYGASLVHENKTALRFYFTAESVEGVTFAAGEEILAPVQKNGMYYVHLGGILPQDLNEQWTLTVCSGSQTLQITYSPMDYILRMYQKETASDETKALVQALYGYYQAAKAYTQSA